MNQIDDPSTNDPRTNAAAILSGGNAVRDNILQVSGELDFLQPYTELRLANGELIRLPTALLLSGAQETYAATAVSEFAAPESSSEDFLAEPIERNGMTVIPVVEERLEVSRRTVATGTVRLHKTVQEYQQALDEPLAVRTFDIERIILNQPVDSAPSVRYEGDTTIYPVVEEQLILTKQLILKEEVRITRRDTERRDTQVVTLRREHLSVERTPRAE